MSSTRVGWKGLDDLPLVGDAYGDPDNQGVLLLHGGGQTRHAWGGTCRALAEAGFYAVAIDMRGHGESGWSPDGDYSLDAYAADLRIVVNNFKTPPAVVGASLGGLTSLIAQGESAQTIVSAVILVDVAHRLEIEGVMRIVSFMTARSAEGFETLDEVADAIAEFLPHRQRPKDLSGLSKNLRRGDDGRYRWHWDPAFISPNQRMDPATMPERLKAASRALSVPTMLVRGRLSDILSEEAAAEFQQLAPHAEYVDVASAAHMIAGDRNDIFTDAVSGFLQRIRAA